VKDNQEVHAGDLLFQIDPKPYEYALQRALADQETLEKQIADMDRTISAQQSSVQSAAAHVSSSEANINSSNAAVQSARASVTSAEAGEARAKADLAYADSNLHRLEPLLTKQYVLPIKSIKRARFVPRGRKRFARHMLNL
jgi:multidrug efflux system membrane fusion protein